MKGFDARWLISYRARVKTGSQDQQSATERLLGQQYVTKSSSGRLQGKRPDLGGVYFRSSWEANYARYLNWLKSRGELLDWKYEPDTFWFEGTKRGVCSYKPDFKVWPAPAGEHYYVEIKGWMDLKSSTKLKRMKKYHPNVRVVLVGATEYRGLDRTIGRFLPWWERPFATASPPA